MKTSTCYLERRLEKQAFWLSLLIMVYYLLELYLRTVNNESLFWVWTSIGYVGILYIFFKKNVRVQYIFLLIFLLTCMLFSSLFVGNIELLGIFFNLQYLGITLILCKYKLNEKLISLLLFLYILFFLYQMFIGIDPNYLFMNSSRNHISTVLLNVLVIYYITMFKNNKRIHILPAFVALLISIWSISRSAIVSLSMVLIGLLIYSIWGKKTYFKNGNNRKRLSRTISRIIIILSCVFLIVYLFKNLTIVRMIATNLNNSYEILNFRLKYEGLNSYSRLGIISSYINESSYNIKNLIFGVDLAGSQSFSLFSNNLHNSFLTAHAYYGLLGLLGIIILIINAIRNYYKRKNWLFIILFVTVLVRASTDIIAFPGYLDSICYFFILDGIKNTKVKSRNINQKNPKLYSKNMLEVKS